MRIAIVARMFGMCALVGVLGIAQSASAQSSFNSSLILLTSDQELSADPAGAGANLTIRPNNSTALFGAGGTGQVSFDVTTRQLTMNVSITNMAAQGLSGLHIHIIPVGANIATTNGPVVVPIDNILRAGNPTILDSGFFGLNPANPTTRVLPTAVFTLTAIQADPNNRNTVAANGPVGIYSAIVEGRAYFNAHNTGSLTSQPGYIGPTAFQGGQVRGNILPSNIVFAPEPGAFALVGVGLLGMAGVASRRKK